MSSTDVVIRPPETQEIEDQIIPLVAHAQGLEVTTKDTHRQALEFLKGLSRYEKLVRDLFREAKEDAHRAHKSICAAERKLLDPIEESRRLTMRKAGDWEKEQRRIEAEERRVAEEKARQEAEEERLLDAAHAQDQGEPQAAQAILDAPVVVPAVEVEKRTAKVEGVSSVTRWDAEVVDFLALVRHVATEGNEHLIGLLKPDQKALRAQAISLKENLRIPGVKAVSTVSSRVSS